MSEGRRTAGRGEGRTAPGAHADAARDFRRDGFTVLRGFLGTDEIAAIRAHVERFVATRLDDLPREHVYCERPGVPGTLKQVQRLFEHDARFAAMFLRSSFERLAGALLGAAVSGRNMQYFDKPAAMSRPTPPHQDGYYFMIEPCEAVTLWLALDAVERENGCVRYVRGSHRGALRPHAATGTLGFSQGITDFGTEADRAAEVAIEARPGDLLAHHAMTIHRAERNASRSRSRRALGFIYYAAHVREDRDAHAAYQAALAASLREKGRI